MADSCQSMAKTTTKEKKKKKENPIRYKAIGHWVNKLKKKKNIYIYIYITKCHYFLQKKIKSSWTFSSCKVLIKD